MSKTKKEKEELKEIEETQDYFDSLWVLMLFFILFNEPPKQDKVINIYMGDGQNA